MKQSEYKIGYSSHLMPGLRMVEPYLDAKLMKQGRYFVFYSILGVSCQLTIYVSHFGFGHECCGS
jgi:hypothetical protein